jgi:D-3-phosphoglycerate dehydrogenase / 2-oxoglutarate reductase
MSPRVLISDKLSPAAVKIFADRGIEADFRPELGADKAALAEAIGDYDGLAVRSITKVTPKLIERAATGSRSSAGPASASTTSTWPPPRRAASS